MTPDPLLVLRDALSDAIGWKSQNQFLISELHRANETNRRLIISLVETGGEAKDLRALVRTQAAEIRSLRLALASKQRGKRRFKRRTLPKRTAKAL
jgi:hypothetical protein